MEKPSLIKHSKFVPGLLILILIVFTFSCQKEHESALFNATKANPQKQQTLVTNRVAEKVALNFTKTGIFSSAPTKSLKKFKVQPTTGYKEAADVERTLTFTCANNKPAFYVITFKPKGFVIVSASKKVSPVLAYSNSSKFDKNNIKGGIADWIWMRKKQIQYLENDPTYSTPSSVQEEWDERYRN